jgi:hypothetical protein
MTKSDRFPPLAPQEPDAPRGIARALIIGAVFATGLILGALSAKAGPLDPGACGRYDAFKAAALADGYARWPGLNYATVDGIYKRVEFWFQPVRAEWRNVAVEAVSGRFTAGSRACVTITSDLGVDPWRVP